MGVFMPFMSYKDHFTTKSNALEIENLKIFYLFFLSSRLRKEKLYSTVEEVPDITDARPP